MSCAVGPRIVLLVCGLVVLTVCGCADLDILPSWFPFQGPASDELPGVVTPAERINRLRGLSSQAAGLSDQQRVRVSEQLAASIRTERDPLIRKEIIRTLGHYPSPAADAVLKAALADSESDVRVAACEAWGRRSDAQSVKLLADMMHGDVAQDVRLAAAKALGNSRSPEAITALGDALNDTDPAMQYRAMLSLKQATGKDLGNDVVRWQQYVKGELPEPTPSLAERFRNLF